MSDDEPTVELPTGQAGGSGALETEAPDGEAGTADAAGPDLLDDGGPPEPAPTRRWRRALVILLVLAGVVAAAAVGAEHLVRGQVESVVRAALPGLSEDAEVTTEGVLLTQVLAGSLDTLDVTGSSLHLESGGEDAVVTSLDLHDVSATLTGVGVAAPNTTETLDASGTITWEDLALLVAASSPSLEEVALAPAEHGTATAPGTLTATSEVLGAEAVFLVEPSLRPDGSMLMTVTEATIGGVTVDLAEEDSLMTRLLGMQPPEFVVDRGLLPQGLAFSAVVVTDEGLRVSMSGQDIDLATLAE